MYVDPSLSSIDLCDVELKSSDTTAPTFAEGTIRSPFLYNKGLIGKVNLWKGDVVLLNCTAIANASDQSHR